MKKNNSLNKEIWKYFLIFSIVVLGFLWIFQVLFLDQYYRYAKIKDIKSVANIIALKQSSKNIETIINNAAYEKEVCVEIIDNNYLTFYSSSSYGRGCFTGKDISMNYKYNFISSGEDSQTYELINPKFNNDTLVYAVRLNNNKYAFVNTSLDPVDSTVAIIQEQLIIVLVVVLILSFVLAYFISNFISSPIVKMSDAAKKLAKRDFVKFESDSNIREINELAETLNYASSELSKTDELRRDLMANVSHDLKTPLTMIKAYAEMCCDLHANNKTKRKEDMDIIVEEVDRLTVLVNDILTLSKMQSNIESIVIEEFDLIVLINDILGRYKVLKETEDYTFNFYHDLDSIMIKADKKKIEQVIYNLINNAINYTGDDKVVTIKISNASSYYLVEIIDTGKGIKEEDLPYIWDKYYKNKKKHKRNLIGTGLGLSIVKNILELHNYEHGVYSEIGKGTNFYFKIKK